MGKVAKKSNANVAVAPAKAPPSRPMTRGKRDAQVKAEKPNAKKQKKDSGLEQAEEKIVEEKTQKNMDICSAEESPVSEEEVKEPADKIVPAQKETQLAKSEQQSNNSEEESDSEDGSEDEDDDEEISDADGETKVAPSNPAKNEEANEEQSESSSEEGSPDEDETIEKAAPKAPVTTEKAKSSPEEGSSEEGSSEEDVEASSDEDEDVATKAAPSKSTTSAAENEMETDDDSEDDGSGSEEDGSGSEEEEPNSKNMKTPATAKAEAQESKTVFIGNLPWSIGEDDIKKFFKGIGEVKESRLAKTPNGKLKGFGHVDFTTSEAAVKALELNGKELDGRKVKIDRALERLSYTPDSGKQNNSQKQVKSGGTTVYVKGFDKNNSEDEIRSALDNHFSSCGEIKDIRIPTEQGSVKGMAYIEFAASDAARKALKLNDSKIGSNTLHVEEAKPRGDGGRSGGRGGGRSGGRGGRSGGRGGGGRRGGRGRGRN